MSSLAPKPVRSARASSCTVPTRKKVWERFVGDVCLARNSFFSFSFFDQPFEESSHRNDSTITYVAEVG